MAMKTTNCNVTPKCPHCGAVDDEGLTLQQHIAQCGNNPRNKNRDLRAEAKRSYERNLSELTEVLGTKALEEAKLQNLDDEIGRLIYCLARDRAIFRAGGGNEG